MFNSTHYVPILKWKRAEQGALKELGEESKKHITPLIQFVMPKGEPKEILEDTVFRFEKQLSKIPEKLLEVWGNTSIFVDFSLLFTIPLKVKSIRNILQEGNKLGATFIPVVYLNDEYQIKEIACLLAKENKSGICLRLTCSDLSDLVKLNQNITELFSSMELAIEDIDLLVDIKEIDENEDKYIKYLHISQKIPNLLNWRTFTFASGSFPKDLSRCKLDEENLIPRLDWINWKDILNDGDLIRKPTFADYTIQYPIYYEAYQFFPPSTSIKYTLEDKWYVMKGRKQKFELYLANAALLANDGEKFYEKNFSFGDKYIAEKAVHYRKYIKARNRGLDIKGTGSTETWLKAGINHHLVLVAHQIASFS